MTRRSAKIAVVIPTYNRRRSLARAVDSVLNSDEPDFELVVVDDGSTDDTPGLMRGLTDRRIEYVRAPHRNGNVARNLGVAASTAPVVAFLDSDDEFEPSRLGRLLRLFDRLPEIEVSLDAFWVENGGRRELADQPKGAFGKAELAPLLVAHAIPLTTSAICARRGALDAVNGFDERLRRHQDRDLLLRLAESGRILLGAGADVTKHQSRDSISRPSGGYVEGLDELVGRHPIFLAPEYSGILSYLVVRRILKAVLAGRLADAGRELRSLGRAANLPRGLPASLLGYGRGRRTRRELAAAALRTKATVRLREPPLFGTRGPPVGALAAPTRAAAASR